MIRTPRGNLTVADVQLTCAKFFGVPFTDIISYNRGSGTIMLARKLAMYLARKMTFASWPELGEAFRRDHSTILVVTKRTEANPELMVIAAQIEESIT
jgi:chromosomal replication initiator protein